MVLRPHVPETCASTISPLSQNGLLSQRLVALTATSRYHLYEDQLPEILWCGLGDSNSYGFLFRPGLNRLRLPFRQVRINRGNLVGWTTGIEPVTSGITTQRSNQLS